MRFLIYYTPFLRKIVILVFNENFLNFIVTSARKHSVLYLKLEVLDMFALFIMSINCKVRIIIKYCSRALEHLFSLYWCHKVFTLMFFTKTTFYKIVLHSFFCIANVHTKECHMLKLFSMRFSLNVMQ